jgi:hypothetical protein
MAPQRVPGLYRSNFGAVKMEADPAAGATRIIGVWRYERDGSEVVGFFNGELDGNVLRFSWREPPFERPLAGEGWILFDPEGAEFSGRWWTVAGDRAGEWRGTKAQAPPSVSAPAPPPHDGDHPAAEDVPAPGGAAPAAAAPQQQPSPAAETI